MSPLSFRDIKPPAVGSTVGPWLLLEHLDHGAYGMVYRARRADSPQAPEVALKLARSPRDERFEREGQLLRRLQHSSIPGFEQEGMWEGAEGHVYPYLVMELVQGLTLYDWMDEAQRTSREVLRMLAQVAQALAAAHAAGAIHRDVKGENIRVTAGGHAVLLDWGSGWFSGARSLTDNIVAPGTSAYRPPEQKEFIWSSRRKDGAPWPSTPTDDLYALGVTLYRAVTGRFPPPCTEGEVLVERIVPRLSDVATVCLELETFTHRLMSDDRKARGTAEQLAREAQEVADTAGPEADKPIVPTVHAMPTEEEEEESGSESSSSDVISDAHQAKPRSDTSSQEERRPRPEPAIPIWLPPALSAVAAMVGGLLGTYMLGPRRSAPAETKSQPAPVAEEWHAPQVDAPDAGVGDVAVITTTESQRSTYAYALTASMPKVPFPGQKKPPCDPYYEVAVLGACWTVIAKKPPCGPGAYELAEKCVRAQFEAPRQPTSGEP